jgi:hypothetical protein
MSYGCYNRQPYTPVFRAKDGKKEVFVDFKMTHDCQYTKSDLGKKDPQCVGCKWRLDEQQAH